MRVSQALRPATVILLFQCIACGSPESLDPFDAGPDLMEQVDQLPELIPERATLCSPGATRCQGNAMQICEEDPQGVRWSASIPCKPDMFCRLGTCGLPTATQLEQAEVIDAMVDHLAGTTGWIEDLLLDPEGLKHRAKEVLFLGDEKNRDFYRAARLALVGFQVGHIAMYANKACGSEAMPWQDSSRLGACARPFADHFIITFARQENPLQLKAGDRITAVNGLRGNNLVDWAFLLPGCGTSAASASHRHSLAAQALLGSLPMGTEVEITPAQGPVRTAVVTRFAVSEDTCRDPFARQVQMVAEASFHPSGVGVVRVPGFFPPQGFLGTTESQLEKEISQLSDELVTELNKVSGAPGLVWDLRGNRGGATPLALSLVGGMPGAQPAEIATCKHRDPGSWPPTWGPADELISFGVEPNSTFAQPQRVAVIIDGLAVSAADYLARAVSQATDVPLVGAPTAGAFGTSGEPMLLGYQPPLLVLTDPSRCTDEQGKALEGRSVQPTHPVTYQPLDLVQGKDTLLEVAVSLVRP